MARLARRRARRKTARVRTGLRPAALRFGARCQSRSPLCADTRGFFSAAGTLTSDDGGKSWAPISDWSKHSMNEALHYDDGEGTFFALGYRAENGPGNRTAANVGWKGRLSAEGGIEVLEAGVKVSLTPGARARRGPR